MNSCRGSQPREVCSVVIAMPFQPALATRERTSISIRCFTRRRHGKLFASDGRVGTVPMRRRDGAAGNAAVDVRRQVRTVAGGIENAAAIPPFFIGREPWSWPLSLERTQASCSLAAVCVVPSSTGPRDRPCSRWCATVAIASEHRAVAASRCRASREPHSPARGRSGSRVRPAAADRRRFATCAPNAAASCSARRSPRPGWSRSTPAAWTARSVRPDGFAVHPRPPVMGNVSRRAGRTCDAAAGRVAVNPIPPPAGQGPSSGSLPRARGARGGRSLKSSCGVGYVISGCSSSAIDPGYSRCTPAMQGRLHPAARGDACGGRLLRRCAPQRLLPAPAPSARMRGRPVAPDGPGPASISVASGSSRLPARY